MNINETNVLCTERQIGSTADNNNYVVYSTQLLRHQILPIQIVKIFHQGKYQRPAEAAEESFGNSLTFLIHKLTLLLDRFSH